MIQKFRKKPVEIEAIQWNGNSNKQEIEQFVGRELKSELESETAYVAGKGAPIFSLLIETKEGVMKAFRGDWIIKEPFPTGDRDFYPCKNDIFANTYDVVGAVGGGVVGLDAVGSRLAHRQPERDHARGAHAVHQARARQVGESGEGNRGAHRLTARRLQDAQIRSLREATNPFHSGF